MTKTWVRLCSARSPIPGRTPGLAWAMWQPGYSAAPWPHDELTPGFAYYVCETQPNGERAATYRATATHVLPPTRVATPEGAYGLMAEHVFDDSLRMGPDEWKAHPYNVLKAEFLWPQRVVAWRATLVAVGPHVLAGLGRFPRTGWLTTDTITL